MAYRSVDQDAAAPSWERAVITGASGFLGGRLKTLLQRKGLEVVGVGRTKSDAVDRVCDYTESATLANLLTPETALFHLAGPASVSSSLQDPWRDFNGNVTVTLRVLDAVRFSGATLLYPSSGAVYESSDRPADETSSVGPSSPYGAAKAAAEAYCIAYFHSFDIDVRIARIFSVFGPTMKGFAISDFVARLDRNPRNLSLRGDGRQVRDYLFVDDAVDALYHVMRYGEAGEIYNVASGRSRAIAELASAVARLMGLHECRITACGNDTRSEPQHMRATVTKLAKLGFKPKVDFEDALATTVRTLQAAL